MKNQHLSASEAASTSIEATDIQPSTAKSLYSAPQLTIHGQLERITQQTNSTVPNGDGDTG